MNPTLLTEWSRLLLGTIARAGVEQVVLSPGSRSTPFAWAALNEPTLKCHSVWDERVAAFFALGQARVTGRPTLLLCTSGSAAAHYYPALIEASLSSAPVLVLTADRPFELQHAAAPQAIDQVKLFGDATRAFYELGAPDAAPSALQGLLRSVAHAVYSTRYPNPGPVHMNARARKPLEPVASEEPSALQLRAEVDRLLARGPTIAHGARAQADVTRLAAACAETARGVIMVGPRPVGSPGAGQELLRLAAISGYPVLCEATSQLRWTADLATSVLRIDAFEWLLRSPRIGQELRPDLILSFGAPPTSAAYERWLDSGFSGKRFVIAEHGFPDPHGIASELVCASTEQVSRSTVELLERGRIAGEALRERFRHAWAEANRLAWIAIERELARADARLSEARAVRSVLDALPDPCLLMLGNSLPIREVDAYVPSGTRRLRVLSQRGANGIDGLISGAAGAASLSTERTVLLLGDVSFLHDLGGLAVAREAAGPFTIVVIDNGGGRIFERLPIFPAISPYPDLRRFWLTPPQVELEHAAKLFGYPYTRVESDAHIASAMQRASAEPGASVVHIVVDGASARQADRRVEFELEGRAGEKT